MIAISVKTSLKEKLGVLCSVDPSASMEDVLFKIQEDLGLPRGMEIKRLVRLMPNGKKMHSMVQKPSYLSDVDFYLARLEDDESEVESSDEESFEEDDPRYSTPIARRSPKSRKVTPISKRKASKKELPYKRPTGKSKRHKAVASVARAAAAASRRSTPAARQGAAVVPAKPRKSRYQLDKQPLTEEERRQLAAVRLDLDKFSQYLYDVEGITRSNINIVVRQVSKLLEGQGIDYKHWKHGISFKPGYVLRLSDDFGVMREEAVAFEKKHGRDRGNGWLVRHPVRKVENYQKYLFNNLIKAPSANASTKSNVITLSSADALKAANAAAVSSDLAVADASESEEESDAESEVGASGAGFIF